MGPKMPWGALRNGSLRWRLTLLAACTITLALAIAGTALTAIFERHLERRVEQELVVRLHELAAAFVLDADAQPALTRAFADPRYEAPLSGSYWQVSDGASPVLRSRSLWDRALPLADPRGREAKAYEITWDEGATLYVLERDVRLTAGGTPRNFRLTVALDHAELEELKTSFGTDVLLALGIIAAALVAGAWLQLWLGLRPLAGVGRQLALVREGRLARLAGRFPTEVAPLTTELNQLIDAQEDSVRRARERAGDLAHGLKTPLTILSGEAGKLEAAGNRAAAERMREQIREMRAHVERQLARARSHGATSAGAAHTDAAALVERLLGLMRRMPRSEQITWSSSIAPGLRLRMDPDDFGEVLGNLLDNARLWAKSRVTVAAAQAEGRVSVCITDDGPGIAPEARTRMVERGESSAPPGEGSGLGLAIANDVLGLYGASLAIEDAQGGGCRISFGVPGWAETAPSTA